MSDQNAIKVVVDTNLWISFLLGKKLFALKNALLNSKVVIFFSEELYNEIIKVIKYPRISRIIPEHEFYELISHFKEKIRFINPDCVISDRRDKKDNLLLELAVTANVDYLVSGDYDLLSMGKIQTVKIISADELNKIIQS